MNDSTGNNLRSLTTVMQKLQAKGYQSNFGIENNQLVDYDSKKTYDVSDLQLDYEFRSEGETDPDDESILFAIQANDGNKGIIVASYSEGNDSSTIEFVNQVDRTDTKDPTMI